MTPYIQNIIIIIIGVLVAAYVVRRVILLIRKPKSHKGLCSCCSGCNIPCKERKQEYIIPKEKSTK